MNYEYPYYAAFPQGTEKFQMLYFECKLTGAEGIGGLMGEKGLMEEDWSDRNNWRKKII
jgi:hypothetical protein